MKLKLSSKALKAYYNNEEIINQTSLQIIKDFGIFGIHISLPVDNEYAYYDLFEQLLPHITELWNTNNKTLLSILYRIDISENEIRLKYDNFNNVPMTKIITELIIERELKKVITRKFYSNKSSDHFDTLSD